MKKINQQESVKKILAEEKISISAMASKIELNRNYISKLINHNVQLSPANFSKIEQSFPEYLVEIKESKKPKEKNQIEKKETLSNTAEIQENKESIQIEQKTTAKIEERFRHKNLNCPHCNYHMKIQYRHLEIARAKCPVHNSPMLTKEELINFKKTQNESESKKFLDQIKPIKLY